MKLSRHPDARGKLLNQIVNDIASSEPQKVFAEIPISHTSFQKGFRAVTYRDLANAINGTAAFLEASLGRGHDFETLMYYGPHDLRYVILTLAAGMAGYKMLFPSPRLSTIAVVGLAEKTGAKTLLLPNPHPPIALQLLDLLPMKQIDFPNLEELLDNVYSDYAYGMSFADARTQPLIVLHTSGSTGLPKPIIWTHEWVSSFADELYLEAPPGFESNTGIMLGSRIFSLFPAFHAGHVMGNILFPIQTGTVNVYPLPGQPPSGEMAMDVLDHAQVDILCLIPPIIEQISRSPALLNRIDERIKYMMWSGGDISASAGDAVSQKIKLWTQLGSTEVGLFHNVRPQGPWIYENWHHVGYHPSSNVDFLNRGSNLFEAVVKQNRGIYVQTAFKLFPGQTEYATGDLYTQHPETKCLWQYHGRADDMQVFLSGEKFYPISVEQAIARHPEVRGALLIGTGRSQAALLVDLELDMRLDKSQVIEQIWPTIEVMNKVSPAPARITRNMIMFVDPKRPFLRTGKGNVQRLATAQLYSLDLQILDAEAIKHEGQVPASAFELLTQPIRM